ncbi:MAG: TRAP transporter small permease [Phycisphaerae bacterium]|jgi:TRAP-type C4-dicarboxylate transport system permease small subunit
MIKKILDRTLEFLVMVVVVVLVIDVLWQVFTRFVLKNPSTWTEEVAVFMLIWVSLLGAAVALGRGAHLGIDYFVGKLPVRIRIYTEVFVFLVVALFSFSVMIVGGTELVIRTLQLEQISPAINVKVGYVYLAIPISGFFLVMYSIIGLVERIAELVRGEVIVDLPASANTEEGVD